jgi:hypothetical protein
MKFVCLIFLLIPLIVSSEETKIICVIKDQKYNKKLNTRFSKIIDFKNRSVENLSGHSFDYLMIFNNYEIVMRNKVFDFTSVFNIKTKKWLIYDKNFIDIYSCKKRR